MSSAPGVDEKHALNTFFDRVYVINLKDRVDRRDEMDAQLRNIGLSLNAPQVTVFEAHKPTEPGGFPTLGARGCFMSHLAVLREARDKGLASVLIVEDDLNFCDGFATRFADAAACLEDNLWGLWYGSYHLDAPPPSSVATCVQVNPTLAVGTSALLAINGPHIASLVEYLDAMLCRPAGDPAGGPMHVDGAYCWYRLAHPEALTWLATPPLGFQRSSRTDVHALRWFDRMGWSAFIVSSLRRLQNRWR